MEGGYSINPNDTGNYFDRNLIGSNLGVTGNAYYKYYNKKPTKDTIKNLKIVDVTPIYKYNYWDKIKGDLITNESLADLMMFIVVNSGVGMVKSLKTIANATAGKKLFAETTTPFTPNEIQLINSLPQSIYFDNIKMAREAFYRNLVKNKPSNAVFLNGWLKRLNSHKYSGVKSSNNNLIIGTLLFIGIGSLVAYQFRS